jgi:hypothetical protein
MPVISRFYGIVITMYFKDHNPPHFHAAYGGYRALISLDGRVVEGELPPRAQRMTLEWLNAHSADLVANWRRAQTGLPLEFIEPLE